ncbi:MAG: GTPase Era [Deltaproteobacteria bacterium]|nr:GTPase Era [Deltaproteobacteria bacterium]
MPRQTELKQPAFKQRKRQPTPSRAETAARRAANAEAAAKPGKASSSKASSSKASSSKASSSKASSSKATPVGRAAKRPPGKKPAGPPPEAVFLDDGGGSAADGAASTAERRKPKGRRGTAAPKALPPRCGTVALVGRPNVGKSSLLNALLGQKIAATTHKPQTTRRTLRGVLSTTSKHGPTQLVFVDTPGLHAEKGGLYSFMLDEALDAAADVDVLAFLVEVDRQTRGIMKVDEEALQRLLQRAPKTPVVLVLNKIDVLSQKAALLPVLQQWALRGLFKAYVPVSAHERDGLDDLVDELASWVPEGAFVFPEDSLTDQSERDIAAELIREKVMLELQQEIPYRTAVLVEHFDESRRGDRRKPLVHVAAVVVVERDSHKSMVIGKGGARIKAIGQRARKDLEHLLQCQVHLELFVKVEADWTQTPQGLRKLGYVRTNR